MLRTSTEQEAVAETESVDVSEDVGLKEIEEVQSTTDGSDESVVESSDFVPTSQYAEQFLNDRLSQGYDSKKKGSLLLQQLELLSKILQSVTIF